MKKKYRSYRLKNEDIACEFVKLTSKLSIIYREDKTRYSMQFLADVIKS